MGDDLGKRFLNSKEYLSHNRGPECLQEIINDLDRVEGVHEEQDDVGPSRERVQGIAFVQEHEKCPPRGTNG